MALEAVVFQQDLFGYNGKDYHNWGGGGSWSYQDQFYPENFDEERGSNSNFEILNICNNNNEGQTGHNFSYYENWQALPPPPPSLLELETHTHTQQLHYLNSSSSPEADYMAGLSPEEIPQPPPPPQPQLENTVTRPKRRRVKCRKNQEDIENQRMTHIAVERNRRKQMNEYLAVLRSLMPESYVQRGDQASIIGGAINFVKELEQRLQFLGTQREERKEDSAEDGATVAAAAASMPFSEFFSFPQYTTAGKSGGAATSVDSLGSNCSGGGGGGAIADVEVTMVESHASIKIRTQRRPKQLLKMVSRLQTLRLTVLHLNVTTVEQIVLYSLSVKVEDECRLGSVDEIATAVHQLLGKIQEEAILLI